MRACYSFVTLLFFASTAFAQSGATQVITSTGDAQGKAIPTHLEFQILATFDEGSFAKGIAAANAFPAKLKEALKANDLESAVVTSRVPAIDEINSNQVIARTSLRIPAPSGANSPDELLLKYATMCDAVIELSKSTQAEIAGPVLTTDNAELVEQDTLKRATENALYKADAIAQILNTHIFEVQSVVIDSLTWHSETDDVSIAPGVDSLTCSAKVTLTYLHQP